MLSQLRHVRGCFPCVLARADATHAAEAERRAGIGSLSDLQLADLQTVVLQQTVAVSSLEIFLRGPRRALPFGRAPMQVFHFLAHQVRQDW